MNTIGIICEYNPFHNGHLYHLEKIKELFSESIIVLVLNGYFLERGEISLISKENKTKIALEAGIDLVVELPFVFGTQSADIFASISIKILERLKCDYVVFGSECNDIDLLNKICDYSINNKEKYDKDVKKYLNEGINYPTAMAKALNIDFDFNSNDLLGISYIKTIKQNKYKIKPITIKRTNNYLDIESNDSIISASNIRNKLLNNIDIKKYIPKYTLKYIDKIDNNKLFELLKYKIITEKDLSIYLDVDEGIENRIKRVIYISNTLDELITNLKSKRYTYNKIRRMLIHVLVGLTKEDNKSLRLDYIRILGFNSVGQNYLKTIKKDISIPISVNEKSLIYEYELKSAFIYEMIQSSHPAIFEKAKKPIKY